jgi:hypothetical protein
MRPKDIVRLKKTVSTAGAWKLITGKSKMPGSALALSKRASFQLGRGWHWRIDVLSSSGPPLRLLTAFSPDHEEFLAWLSTPQGEGNRVLARYEFHGTHPGWHCHTACCDSEDIPVGDPSPREFSRAPAAINAHRRQTFDLTEASALSTSFKFFRVVATPKGAMI